MSSHGTTKHRKTSPLLLLPGRPLSSSSSLRLSIEMLKHKSLGSHSVPLVSQKQV
jgi:hypothetical protein